MKLAFTNESSEAQTQTFEFHFWFRRDALNPRHCAVVSMETLLFNLSPPLHQFQRFKSALLPRLWNSRVFQPVFIQPLKQPVLVLPQVTGDFDRQDFNKMCWTLCSRKNLNLSRLLISSDDAFKIWCIFNFLSEDQYPLVIITEEVRSTPEPLRKHQQQMINLQHRPCCSNGPTDENCCSRAEKEVSTFLVQMMEAFFLFR